MTTTVDTITINYYQTSPDATIYDLHGRMVIHHHETDTCITLPAQAITLAPGLSSLITGLASGDWEPVSVDAGRVHVQTAPGMYVSEDDTVIDITGADVAATYTDGELDIQSTGCAELQEVMTTEEMQAA